MTHEERINWVRFNLTGKLKREFDEVLQEERDEAINECFKVLNRNNLIHNENELIVASMLFEELKGREE